MYYTSNFPGLKKKKKKDTFPVNLIWWHFCGITVSLVTKNVHMIHNMSKNTKTISFKAMMILWLGIKLLFEEYFNEPNKFESRLRFIAGRVISLASWLCKYNVITAGHSALMLTHWTSWPQYFSVRQIRSNQVRCIFITV